MAIYYADEHVNCTCYSDENSSAIEIVSIVANKSKEFHWKNNTICIVVDGQVTLVSDDAICKNLLGGEFLFAPPETLCIIQAEQDSKLLLFSIPDNIRLCQSFDVFQLFENVKTNNNEFSLLKFNVLPIRIPLDEYVRMLIFLLEDGLKCVNFMQMKVDELLLLLRAYYTKEELRDFFSYILNPNAVFIEFIRRNWMNYKTITELAEAMNISPQHFNKRFKEIFNQSPGSWIQDQKAKLILSEIRAGVKSFQQISDEYGFAAQSHFNRFCKKMLGDNPNSLRRGTSFLVQKLSDNPSTSYIKLPIQLNKNKD